VFVRSASRAQSLACSSYSFFSAEIIVVYLLLDKRARLHTAEEPRAARNVARQVCLKAALLLHECNRERGARITRLVTAIARSPSPGIERENLLEVTSQTQQ
jgi:hypothetical protein